MTEIRFYHLLTRPLESALPEILAKALDQGRRIVVRAPDEKAAERLNESLWTFKPESFLPHGSRKDGFAAEQPIWLTHTNDNPNEADVLILTGGTQEDDISSYALCCEMLENPDEAAIEAARARWKNFRKAGHDVTYWQQTEKGWEKKA